MDKNQGASLLLCEKVLSRRLVYHTLYRLRIYPNIFDPLDLASICTLDE